MKLSPQEQEQIKLFGPSKFSADGFLGNDTRLPQEIIAEDESTVVSLGTTCEAIADILDGVFDKAENAFGDTVEIRTGISAVFYEARGKIPSPFRGDGIFQKGETIITDSGGGNRLILTRLGIHLIRKHHFFQGYGSRFRIEPKYVYKHLS
jgi:hypothetical protein